MISAIWINSRGMKVEPVELPDNRHEDAQLAALQKLVGGFIESVYLPNGDILFVDEDGHRHDTGHWFRLDGLQPMLGNGVIVGRHDPHLANAHSTAEQVRARVTFQFIRQQALPKERET